MPSVSVIIVSYNSASDVLRCIESLQKWSGSHSLEIVVVDNNSRNEDFARLASAPATVRIIRNNRNLGFGAANNRGAARALGEYLFFLNPDTYLLNDAVGEFIQFMDTPDGKGAGVAGCLLEDAEGNANHSYGDFASMRLAVSLKRQLVRVLRSAYRAVFRPGVEGKAIPWEAADGPFRVDWITGADLFMRREAFSDAGGFDERIFLYSEEVDIQRRLRSSGWSRWIIGGPRIAHLHGRYDRLSNEARIHFQHGLFSYFTLYEPSWMVVPAFILYKACCILNGIFELPRGEYSFSETIDFFRAFQIGKVRSMIRRERPIFHT